MFFTSERISLLEYIASPTPTRSKFVFQQPKLSYENNLFLLSFRWTVWYSTVGLVFILFVALLVVSLWEWRKTEEKHRVCVLPRLYTLITSMARWAYARHTDRNSQLECLNVTPIFVAGLGVVVAWYSCT